MGYRLTWPQLARNGPAIDRPDEVRQLAANGGNDKGGTLAPQRSEASSQARLRLPGDLLDGSRRGYDFATFFFPIRGGCW